MLASFIASGTTVRLSIMANKTEESKAAHFLLYMVQGTERKGGT